MGLPEKAKDFHHAYVMHGIDSQPVLRELEARNIGHTGNPDVILRDMELLDVAYARELVRSALTRPISASAQYFIISCASITREAQNALLKALEEPTGSSVFFFVLPYPEMLLPTVQSRVHIVSLMRHANSAHGPDPKAFLQAAPAARLKMLESLLPKRGAGSSGSLEAGKNMRAVLGFLHALEEQLSTTTITKVGMKRGLQALYRAKRYITDRGASIKILLEHVALLVPQVSV